MTSPSVDRRNGLNSATAIKAPVRVASTSNLTLRGLQTVDGVSLASGDRVLVAGQSNSIDNGIYVADTGTWQRDVDFDDNRDASRGTIGAVMDGSYQEQFWMLTTSGLIHPGSTPLNFSVGIPPTSILGLANGSSLVGFIQAGVGAVMRTVQDELRDRVSVKQFGAKGDGATLDQTAILNAYAECSKLASKARTLHFPPGFYNVGQLLFENVQDFTFEFDNAVLVGVSSGDSVFKIVNAFNVKLSGTWIVLSAPSYDNGVYITAEPGGPIQEDMGIVTRLNIDNLTVQNAKCGLKIGEFDNDAQIAEIAIKSMNSIKCPTVAHIGGSQAGVMFVGGNLTSEPNVSYPGAQESCIINEGSFVATSGTELTLTNSSTGKTVWMTPARTATYGNPYGMTRIIGGHVESASPLCVIENVRFPESQFSANAAFVAMGTGGYVSPALNDGNYIDVQDSAYEGSVIIQGCNFYSGFMNHRNALNISCAGDNTSVETDRLSWRAGFLDWMGGVGGGTMRHSFEAIVYADNLNNQSVASGATAGLVFTANLTSDQFNRYRNSYDPATGIFTVPPGGLKVLSIHSMCRAASGTPEGSFAVFRNGVYDGAGWIADTAMGIEYQVTNVPAGTTFAVALTNTSVGAVQFGVSGGDRLIINASN